MADPDESLSVAAGLRFHAVPIWGAASAFLPGADPIPESGGDEAADSRRDSRADRHGLSGPYPRILARECEDFATLSLEPTDASLFTREREQARRSLEWLGAPSKVLLPGTFRLARAHLCPRSLANLGMHEPPNRVRL